MTPKPNWVLNLPSEPPQRIRSRTLASRTITLQFKGDGTAIEKGILGKQRRAVIEHLVTPIHRFVACQCRATDGEEEGLCRLYGLV